METNLYNWKVDLDVKKEINGKLRYVFQTIHIKKKHVRRKTKKKN